MMINRSRSVWRALAVASLVVVAASCGSDDESATTPASVDESAITPASDDESATTSVSDESTPTTDSAAADPLPRTVATPNGDVTIEEEPQRIVALSGQTDLDSLIILGRMPIAACVQNMEPGEGETKYPAYLPGSVETDIEPFECPPDAINVEYIASLEPDLIIGDEVRAGDVFDQLSGIAPTITFDRALGYEANLLTIAAALGETPAAEQWLTEFDTRLDEVGTIAADAGFAEIPIAILDPYPEFYSLNGAEGYPGDLLTRLGFGNIIDPPGDPAEGVFGGVGISPEQLVSIEGAEYLFVLTGFPERVAEVAELRTSPVFQSISAVEAGNVIEVSDYWWYYPTPLSHLELISDVERIIAGS